MASTKTIHAEIIHVSPASGTPPMPAPARYATRSRSPALRIWWKPISSFLKFAREFEKRFVGRGEDGDRTIIVALAIAWQRLSLMPPESLTRAGETDLAKYRHWERETEAA